MPAQTPPNVVPPDLLVSLLEEVSSDLGKLSTHKSSGTRWNILKQFAPELAPLVQDIYNESLREEFVPDTLKRPTISPVPYYPP